MKTWFVDSFTTEKFKGNPAAVCLAEAETGESTMQSIATEIGFSETAFIRNIGTGRYSIRFFTPKKEIKLCGHATLAASKILFGNTQLDNISFLNCDNVELKISKADGKIVMQFPVYDTEPVQVPAPLLSALGIEVVVNKRYSPNNKIILLEIDSAEKLSALQPDFNALLHSHHGINGVLVTAPSDSRQFDFHYRYFWPWAGTNEDPVTGGVQTFLTKYWATKLGKNKLNAFQSSHRTGIMSTELTGDKVLISGEAVITFEGDFKL